MDELNTPLINPISEATNTKSEPQRSVFRLRTNCWHDDNSIHIKRSLTRLKRLSSGGYEHLLDEAINIGAYDAIEMINNLSECKDGVYVAVFVEGYRDYETGILEDWEYKLVPYNPDPPTAQ